MAGYNTNLGWPRTLVAVTGLLLASVSFVRAEEPAVEAKKTKKEPFVPKAPNFEKMRDPFTFFTRREIGVGPDSPEIVNKRALEEAKDKYLQGEKYFKDRRFKEAETACNEGLEKLNEIREPSSVTGYEDLISKLTRLKKAADRMIKRYETEDALEKLKLEVSGVFSRVNVPQALVSFNTGTGQTSMIVRIGDKILDSSIKAEGGVLADAPTVRDIQPRRVIIDFRGYKMELPISSDTDTPEVLNEVAK